MNGGDQLDFMRLPLISLTLAACLAAAGCVPGSAADPGHALEKQTALPFAWPPVLGQQYPDLQLQDAQGQPFELYSLRGKVLLIEPVGMT